jgi:hypothetical protein
MVAKIRTAELPINRCDGLWRTGLACEFPYVAHVPVRALREDQALGDVDVAATPADKAALSRLSADLVAVAALAGEPIREVLSTAPGTAPRSAA